MARTFPLPPPPLRDTETVSAYSDNESESNGFWQILVGMAKSQHAPRYRLLPGMLHKMREEARFTQRDLAKKLKVSQPWVHKSEIGERRVDVAEFLDWCLACGVDPEKALRTLREQRNL